jgi:hypothetical protein
MIWLVDCTTQSGVSTFAPREQGMPMKNGFRIRSSKVGGLLCALVVLLWLSIPSALASVSRGLLTLPKLATGISIHIVNAVTVAALLGSEPTTLALFGGGLVLIALLLRRRLKQRRATPSDRPELKLQTHSG